MYAIRSYYGSLVHEAQPELVDEDAVGIDVHHRLGLARARIDRFGVVRAEVARRRRARRERHADALALVVVAAARHRPDMRGAGAERNNFV